MLYRLIARRKHSSLFVRQQRPTQAQVWISNSTSRICWRNDSHHYFLCIDFIIICGSASSSVSTAWSSIDSLCKWNIRQKEESESRFDGRQLRGKWERRVKRNHHTQSTKVNFKQSHFMDVHYWLLIVTIASIRCRMKGNVLRLRFAINVHTHIECEAINERRTNARRKMKMKGRRKNEGRKKRNLRNDWMATAK